MKKTLTINLGGFMFHIDEDAYFRLEQYLNVLKSQFLHTEGGRDIISDIESRIAEIFKDHTGQNKEVINLGDVEEMIDIMGKPEDYIDPDQEEQIPPPYSEPFESRKRIFRDPDNKMIGGVCAGLAAYFDIDPLWIRIIFLILFFGAGFGLPVYLIMWLIIPEARTTAEKLQMRGETVNITNIERAIRDEIHGINEHFRGFKKKASNYDYRKTGNQVGNFFSDLGNFIVDAAKLLLRVLGKLIGFFFLFIGFTILLAVCASIFVGSIQVFGSSYSTGEMVEFLKLLTINNSHYQLLLAGIVLSIVAPLFLLIYWGIRILFNLEPLSRVVRGSLAFVTFLGFVIIIIAGVQIGIQFSDQAYASSTVQLGEARHYTLVGKDSLDNLHNRDFQRDWVNMDGRQALRHVKLQIRRAKGNSAYIEVLRESQGPNRRLAHEYATNIIYDIKVKDSIIEFPAYLTLPEDAHFRDQRISLVLYLPEGDSVFLDESLDNVIYDVANVQNMWDYEMLNKTWIMQPEGLNCEGCTTPVEKQEESTPDSDKIEIDSADDGLQIRVNGNSVKISGTVPDSLRGPALKVLNHRLQLYI